ncbi:ROK family protein [Cyclobacterium jeungdonense]|uniref:ROK family protein n=1 Tax=Cyclobacterium jeungdonense TaxID=708087 RepID=A0ABT8CBB4_9BACT|nr:ROK family protein [Cyclobacterium jeungdonense]MDN3688966.1 ROK family protein [Cyclobacterium jeungdonense]
MGNLIGVDIGGSHISVGIITEDGKDIFTGSEVRMPVNSFGSKEEILEVWTDCIAAVGLSPNSLLGIAMPAPFDYQQGISLMVEQGKYLALYQVNVKKELSYRLGIPAGNILFLNDAAAFLQGEAVAGGWDSGQNLMGLTFGTGLGGAFKSGDLAEDGAVWSIPFKEGIAENYLSTSFFKNWAKERFGKTETGLKPLLDSSETRAATLDMLAVFGRHLADLIEMQAKIRKMEIVVLGGNIMKAADHFLPLVKKLLGERDIQVEIRISRLGEKAAMIGAASIHHANGKKM